MKIYTEKQIVELSKKCPISTKKYIDYYSMIGYIIKEINFYNEQEEEYRNIAMNTKANACNIVKIELVKLKNKLEK